MSKKDEEKKEEPVIKGEIKKKLKPVVFVQGKYSYNKENTSQQLMLLKAMKKTQDPQKLKELIGVKTAAEVYRTLDKISMRKEYHDALLRNGISFDFIVSNVKGEIETAEKSSDRLNGLKMLLQSLGMDKYEETAIGSAGWEEALAQIKEQKQQKGEEIELPEYEVDYPEIPEGVKEKREKNIEITSELYD